MSAEKSDFQKMLDNLKTDYLNNMPDKLSRMQSLLEDSNAGDLREEFHKFKGNGTTYGIPDITSIGEITEQLFVKDAAKGLEATPFAITLLNFIYEHELEKKEYNILETEAYQKLKAI